MATTTAHEPDSPLERGAFASGSTGRTGDRIFSGAATGAGVLILTVLAGVATFLIVKAWPAITAPTDKLPNGEGLVSFIAPLAFGTILSATLAILIAVPMAVAVSLFVTHYAPKRIAQPLGYTIDLLAAIPSIIYGLWGIAVLGPASVSLMGWLEDNLGWFPLFAGPASATGRTMLVVSVVLAVMVLPIITAVTREVFSQTPRRQMEAALALGATRWEMIRMTVLPFGKSAVIGASMLGLGRALGETMAVAIILSVSDSVTFNLISSTNPSTIAANIALDFPESSGIKVNALIASGLVLFAITLVVNMAARAVIERAEEEPVSAATADPPAGRRVSLTTGRLPSGATWGVYAAGLALIVVLILATGVSAIVAVLGTIVLASAGLYAWSRAVEDHRRAKDRLMTLMVVSAFSLAITPLVSLLYTVISRGVERFDGDFFTESARNVVGAGGGASHAIVGTLIITGIATVISVPIGVMAGIYLREYGHGPLKRWLTFFVDVMTGIPSIVAGLFAYALFAIFLGPGVRLGIVGAVALSVLMIPIVVRSVEEMLKIVPNSLREASYALGVPKWRTVTKVVLPTALAGIITGVMVAVARVIGETAPLLITTGVVSTMNTDPFDGRMQSLPVFSFSQYKNPGAIAQPYIDRAWAAALTLIVIVMVLNLIARLIYRRFGTELR